MSQVTNVVLEFYHFLIGQTFTVADFDGQNFLGGWLVILVEELNEIVELKGEIPEWYAGNTLIPEEDWIEYVAMEYNKENLKKIEGYHVWNPFSQEN